MVFDEKFTRKISRYGICLVAKAGRYHFVASLAEKNKIRLLCLTQHQDLSVMTPQKIKWFPNESCAIKALLDNPKACHKCMRAIETRTMDSTPNK